MLNWLFSSFTYLPNFLIWLPGFSSPWLVKLASKCHSAILIFVQFLDFLSLCKESIFCEIIFVSKRALVILIRMLYSMPFFKATNFVNLFSFICMIYKWGGDFIGSNFPRGGFSQGAIFSGENFWGEIFTGVNFHFIGEIFIGEYFHWGPFSGGGAIFLIPWIVCSNE